MFGLRMLLGNIGAFIGGGFGAAVVFLALGKGDGDQSVRGHGIDFVSLFFGGWISKSVALAVMVPLGALIGAFFLGYVIPKWFMDKDPSVPPSGIKQYGRATDEMRRSDN